MIGKTFGRLSVIEYVGRNKRNRRLWRCLCACKNSIIVVQDALKSGNTRSCGCLHKEVLVFRNTTHNRRRTRCYGIWAGMIKRCNNVNDKSYAIYGARGIKVCASWMKFEAFYKDMGDPPSNYHSIDRLDNDGDYEPENCVWASSYEQAQNRSNNKLIEYDGKTQPLVAWTRELRLDYDRTKQRLRLGWSIEDAFEVTKYRRVSCL
jgi:hypothetical protein